ncbi:amidohydrolase family protein [Alkaliphilus pronyensis]|uniref:Amidohydrolase family protein n=1 Tax=Alkaliphilus pronyensis TaxID=1482732 RepID=A0A6I0F5Y2_9FIRM|nr:amidohydrolase family protein [Alkaliphilus pronyensis]KAB3535429.1 amidohydrolase family protein [Alkaliphilus pronyensis]
MKRLVINNGYVIDPANKISSLLNIAIEGGKIVEISNDILHGEELIDAEGLIISPGFIDCHMHEDPYDPELDKINISIFNCMLRMGVTTAVGGNCGSGPVDIPKYINAIDRAGLPVNFSMLVPHNILRALEGINDKYGKASPVEISNMKIRAQQYLDLGCLGISFGIRYVPGLDEKELKEISSACKKDKKIIVAHIRDDAKNVIASAKELIEIGLNHNLPIQISHLGSMGAYGQMEELLSLIDYHKLNGLDISADCYPYNAFSTSVGATTYDSGFLERYGADYEAIEIAEGKYKGQRCTEEIFKELRDTNPAILTIGHFMREEDVDKAISHPNVFIASDGVMHNYQGHPRAAGTFPRVISKYVKEKQLISLYDAIGKMTWLPAKKYGLAKGTLSIGSDGDILIFDYNEIKDNSTFEEPALPPNGIKYVLVNGEISCKDNNILSYTSGRFIRTSTESYTIQK